jgi:hypothetical protein
MRLARSTARAGAAVAALAALAACDNDPVTPAASADAVQFRRLLVADSSNFARLYSLETGARVDSLGGLPGRITYLYTAMGRVAAAHFQAQNRVAFIDAASTSRAGVASRPRRASSARTTIRRPSTATQMARCSAPTSTAAAT